jgi:hypothetical protein
VVQGRFVIPEIFLQILHGLRQRITTSLHATSGESRPPIAHWELEELGLTAIIEKSIDVSHRLLASLR